MQASQRLDRFGAEVFASLNNKLLALKAQGKTIYNMSVGTPDFKPYDHVVEALTQAAQDPEMWKYALRDLPELKQAVCDYYERRFSVSGITPSTSIIALFNPSCPASRTPEAVVQSISSPGISTSASLF